MKASLILLAILNALLLAYGINLPQENPEELFLTDTNVRELDRLKKDFEQQDLVFVSGIDKDSSGKFFDQVESMQGEFSPLDPLLPTHGVMSVPEMSDKDKFTFFRTLEQSFPSASFAGDSYTNAHLAGMSIRIQEYLFPAVFAVILVGLLLLTRNVPASAYLFLSSLFGTGIGMAIVKVLYGHSTILTTLTPLIAFILTLGVQLHVVYGVARYKSYSEFEFKKLRPIYLMMITTVIGFFGLITSDLISIRQLAVSTSVTLVITWGILLLMVRFFLPKFNVPLSKLLQREWKPPKKRAFLGNVILTILLVTGTVGLFRMPLLVEAIHFFPNDHLVQKGYHDIMQGLGGIPQLDLVVKRRDGGPLSYEDHKKISLLEKRLGEAIPGEKILSLNELVKFANQKYSGSNQLPDNDFAYQALAGRIPELLRHYMASESASKISLTTQIPSVEKRKEFLGRMKELLSFLGNDYEVRPSGLTHLLLESQEGLIRSLINSFLISFLFVSVVFGAFSRDLKATLVFSFLNFASVMGGIGLMWILGFTLNVSSVMTVSISMGLVVDSTIHLLYAEKLNEGREAVYATIIIPIIISHILLFVAFAGLSLVSFVPIRDFSLGLIMLLFVGLLCDLLVLPLMTNQGGKAT